MFLPKTFVQKLKRFSKMLRFLMTLGQHFWFSLCRYHAYLIVNIVWSTSYWTNFTTFWTDWNFCECMWNVINFYKAKDDAV